MIRNLKHSSKGFTLIEMLAVIAIIGILTSIAMPNLSGAREKARDSERVTEVSEIALALELYYNACRQYPATLATTANNGCPSGVTLFSFLKSVPDDPLNSGGNVYTYAVGGTNNSAFVVHAKLEKSNSALLNDLDGTVLGKDCGTSANEVGAGPYYYCKGS